jgi:inulin fructotransferase (DFA-I-forming)
MRHFHLPRRRLEASSTETKILYSAKSSELQAYTDNYSLVATP